MKAIIMAGGKGTRLKPMTCNLPKPMVPILNKPVMEYSIELLKKYGITDIGVTLAYMPTCIIDYFGNGERWEVNLHHFIEETPMGTGGSVKNAEPFIDDTLIIISGDALTDINLQKAVDFHQRKNSKATLVLKDEETPIDYGVVITSKEGKIIRFLEKPSWGEVFSNTINTGIYILEPEVLDYYNRGDIFDFSKDLFPKLLRDQVPLFGYIMEEYWCDVGDLRSYRQTHCDILQGNVKLPLKSKEVMKGIWIGEGTEIGEGISLQPPVYIGSNCIIKNNVGLIGPTIIGENCSIGEGATIKRSILWDHVNIDKNTSLRGAVLCNQTTVKSGAEILENVVVGEATLISSGALIKPDIKIWPHKRIEENTIVNQNLVWGTKISKTLFGYRNISGEMNIDISPEFAARLGAAFSSALKGDPHIIISSDGSNEGKLIQSAIMAGVASTGAQVMILNESFLPMTRFAVRYYETDGGIHIHVNPNLNKCCIEFIDHSGSNITRSLEKEIEYLFSRGDFKRCSGDKVRQPVENANFGSIFFREGLKKLENLNKIKQSSTKVIIAALSFPVLSMAETFLKDMGCHVKTICPHDKNIRAEAVISTLVKQIIDSKAAMGVFFSSCGEEIVLIDEIGRIMGQEKYNILTTKMVLKQGKVNRIIHPYISSRIIDQLAKTHGVELVRTKSDPASIMNEMLKGYGKADTPIQYIFRFMGIWAIGLIIDFLTGEEEKLSVIVDQIPEPYFVKKEVQCGWQDKGRVMKEMILSHGADSIELFEGVKMENENGWALVLPDSEKPLVNIYSEGFSQEYAEELSAIFSEKVINLINNRNSLC
ncbi:mannose-1-phosphate guanylyltransferase / phosphomannomutase [Geosporobacter subterraneus DSM 17957]|uniref:Mannose-1-phosphate guanylyltransferase / phosphomannomutase n=1 Tax=Geosporobacter subterraneus DSM 17957 TaxID=1121919 RepID=A0A1M6LBJ9_9FIRM|nr:sugar phosphate nucleotidyltransferase [Geosporobacter subterraneus]SHJ68505.1 mannose-1-phosphate guanylyltransferase / phosphomannomutase [Geosporobacter subterraneus DSM 17957]